MVGGAIARSFLDLSGIEIVAFVSQVGELKINQSLKDLDFSKLENNELRCPVDQCQKKWWS